MKKRLLITGGTGLLALNWACAMREKWDVTLGTHHHSVSLAGVGSHRLYLGDPIRLHKQIELVSPDLVVHTAGLTSVDMCEQFPDLAYQANVEITRNVALAVAKHGAALIHISTDHLFSGRKSMIAEGETYAPVNHYANSKALGEMAVINANPSALVLRTNFFGWGHARRHSFTDWLICNLRANKELSLFDDVFFTPILADALALAAHELVEKGVSGIFNMVGDQRLSKYQFARILVERFSLPEHLLLPHSFNGTALKAPRPTDMSLNNRKAREALGRELGDASHFLALLFQQEAHGRSAELFSSVTPN